VGVERTEKSWVVDEKHCKISYLFERYLFSASKLEFLFEILLKMLHINVSI